MGPCTFLNLPVELLLLISRFLDIEDLAALLSTSNSASRILIPLIANQLSPSSESILTGAIVCRFRHLLPRLLPHMKPSTINARDTAHHMSALHHASYLCDTQSVSLLLKYKADPSLRSHGGSTALHIAALGRGKVIPLLLSAPGVDVNIRNDDGATALHFACSRNRFEEAAILLRHGADPNIADNESWTPLHSACFKGHTLVVRALLETPGLAKPLDKYIRDRVALTPLHYASFRGHLPTVQLLLENSVDPNISDPVRLVPLCAAASAGNTTIVSALLKFGAQGVANAFCCAAAAGQINVVEMLLSHGEETLAPRWAYSMVMAATRGYEGVLRCMLKSGYKIGKEEKRCLVAAAGAGKLKCVKVCVMEHREIEGGWVEEAEEAMRRVAQNEAGAEIRVALERYLMWESEREGEMECQISENRNELAEVVVSVDHQEVGVGAGG